jgi:hypothetical protein
VDVPFVAGTLEGFGTAFEGGDFWECFQCGMGAVASPSKADEPESYKSNVFGARPPPPPPAEVEDIFALRILTFTEEVFSMILSPEVCELNFFLCFRGLASANSCTEV